MDSVRSLFIPVESGNLLVPNAAIAEIVKLVDPEPFSGGNGSKKEWLRGAIQWREQKVPLISYDMMIGENLPLPVSSARIVIMKGHNDLKKLPYFAISTQKIPKLVTIFSESIEALEDEERALQDFEICNTLANGEPAIIPDIEKIERKIIKELK
ncbi:MAG: chemotaxis protein CheW [Gammaproteobacteria bacterium]|nr:MAG: chemotaxis protein CheW [Gammaproteobacteria bacterium]